MAVHQLEPLTKLQTSVLSDAYSLDGLRNIQGKMYNVSVPFIHCYSPYITKYDDPGSLFIKKKLAYWYKDSHYKPETVARPSQVYNGDSYARKTASF